MRTLAITGIVTVVMISRITLIDAMRATPPSLRISEGTRSRAITAHAPAFSAIFACSAFVTSMITPPLSISARPTFTRHSFDPLLPLPLPFTFFASILLLLSLLEPLDGLSPSNLFLSFHFCPITTNLALLLASTSPAASRISPVIKMFLPFCSVSRPSTIISCCTLTGLRYSTVNSAVTARTSRNRQTFPIASSSSTAIIPPCANPPPPWYLSPKTNRPTIRRFLLSCSNVNFIPPALSPPHPKHLFTGFGSSRIVSLKSSPRRHFLTSLLRFLRPAPLGCVPPGGLRAAVCAFQSSAIPPAWPRRARSAFHPGSQSPAAAYSAAALARRSTVPAQTARRVLSRESAIRWHRIPAASPATNTCRLPAVSSACPPACACAMLHPTPPAATYKPSASLRRAC